jgi:hypothetical protein
VWANKDVYNFMAPAGHEVTAEEPTGQKPPGERNGERTGVILKKRDS